MKMAHHHRVLHHHFKPVDKAIPHITSILPIEISIIYICSETRMFCTERETQMEPHLEPMMAMRRKILMGIPVAARMGIG
jgi:hypothetical protein